MSASPALTRDEPAAQLSPLERLAREPDLSAAQVAEQIGSATEAAKLLEDLAHGWQEADHGQRARALVLAQLVIERAAQLGADAATSRRVEEAARALTGDSGPAALGRAASAEVAAALALTVRLSSGQPRGAIERDQVVCATAPARVDFAGGWSDTPPICSDRGGTVVNAAVTLNGQYAIRAIAKLTVETVVRLTSIDLEKSVVLDRVEQILDYSDPDQWDALPRACLSLAGFSAGRTSGDLGDVLAAFGGGVDLTVSSALPKGSGLGTSSILGSTVLACLARLTGQALTREHLVGRTLLVEQMLTTGGGWQDQVGGIYPGVKLAHTRPGDTQIPTIVPLTLDPDAICERLLLYDTGLTRLAKGILQNVVHRHLARDPEQLAIIDELKSGALELRTAIDRGDVEEFGRGVRRYWELKKRIDPGATTPTVERLVQRVERDCLGYGLTGAGGGGFFFMVARDAAAAGRIRQDLTERPLAPGSRFYDFAIDDRGLDVSALPLRDVAGPASGLCHSSHP